MSTKKYDDIISLPHHRSENRPHMTNLQRAAQFSAFAALRGFDDEIAETARTTEEEIELSEERRRELSEIAQELTAGDKISVTYFRPDAKKAGGAYLKKTGVLKKIDPAFGTLEFADGVKLPLSALTDLSRA